MLQPALGLCWGQSPSKGLGLGPPPTLLWSLEEARGESWAPGWGQARMVSGRVCSAFLVTAKLWGCGALCNPTIHCNDTAKGYPPCHPITGVLVSFL